MLRETPIFCAFKVVALLTLLLIEVNEGHKVANALLKEILNL